MLQLHGQLHQHHLQTHQVTMDDLLAMQVAACNSRATHGSSENGQVIDVHMRGGKSAG